MSAGLGSSDYDEVTASGQTIRVGAGESYSNKLVDLSNGADFYIILEGNGAEVRDVGFKGTFAGENFLIAITAPNGSVTVENVYMADGANKNASDFVHGPGGIFYHTTASCDVTFRYCNVQGMTNNGFYCSNSASGGDILWENCYAANNGVASYRGASPGDEIRNCVAYNDNTDYGQGYNTGWTEANGRCVWAWDPGPVDIYNSEFDAGPYGQALLTHEGGSIRMHSGELAGGTQGDVSVDSTVGSSPNLAVPEGVPTTPEQAATGGGGGGGPGGSDPSAPDDGSGSDPTAPEGPVDGESITLHPGESQSGTLTWADVPEGYWEVTVVSEDDTAERQITVGDPDGGSDSPSQDPNDDYQWKDPGHIDDAPDPVPPQNPDRSAGMTGIAFTDATGEVRDSDFTWLGDGRVMHASNSDVSVYNSRFRGDEPGDGIDIVESDGSMPSEAVPDGAPASGPEAVGDASGYPTTIDYHIHDTYLSDIEGPAVHVGARSMSAEILVENVHIDGADYGIIADGVTVTVRDCEIVADVPFGVVNGGTIEHTNTNTGDAANPSPPSGVPETPDAAAGNETQL